MFLLLLARWNTKVGSMYSFHRKYSQEVTMKIETPYKLEKLNMGPEKDVKLTKGDALKYFTQMTMMRKMEARAAELYLAQDIRGFCHLYTGQEACAVGMKAAMRDQDTVITSYRSHTWSWIMGRTPYEIFAELLGRVTGCSRGRGGSMHMYCPRFFGGNGIVGAQVPLGAGAALYHKYKGDGGVCYALYGDGAANQGQIHEAYNLSKVLDLPCIFVCENNKYGMGTSDIRASGTPKYYTRGCFLPGLWVDGMDVLAVREATRFALAHILSGKGPMVMELETYRYFGHSMSDPGTTYRSREEVQKVRTSKDPINKFREKIILAKLSTEDELKKIDKDATNEVLEVVKKAKEAPVPTADNLYSDIYIDPIQPKIRGITVSEQTPHNYAGKLFIQENRKQIEASIKKYGSKMIK